MEDKIQYNINSTAVTKLQLARDINYLKNVLNALEYSYTIENNIIITNGIGKRRIEKILKVVTNDYLGHFNYSVNSSI